jgi:RimJ/RimL family protein N-acetyltransferase
MDVMDVSMAGAPAQWPFDAYGLRLRTLREHDDFAVFFGYRSDPQVSRYQGWWPMSDVGARDFLREQAARNGAEPGRWVQWAITDLATDWLLGDMGIWLAHDRSEAEIGITVVPSAQGRGVGRRAVRAAVKWLFADPATQRIRADADARNVPCRRMLIAAGFRETGAAHVLVKEEACIEHRYLMEPDLMEPDLMEPDLMRRDLMKRQIT